MTLAKNYFGWQARLVRPEIGQRVLEVGCGVGNFTGMLLDRKVVIALDKEHACIERLQQRYPSATESAGLRLRCERRRISEIRAISRRIPAFA